MQRVVDEAARLIAEWAPGLVFSVDRDEIIGADGPVEPPEGHVSLRCRRFCDPHGVAIFVPDSEVSLEGLELPMGRLVRELT